MELFLLATLINTRSARILRIKANVIIFYFSSWFVRIVRFFIKIINQNKFISMKYFIIMRDYLPVSKRKYMSSELYHESTDMYDDPISCLITSNKELIKKIPDNAILEQGLTSDDAKADELLYDYRANQIYQEVGECDPMGCN